MHKMIMFGWLGLFTALATHAYGDEADSDLPEWVEERVEPFRARVGN